MKDAVATQEISAPERHAQISILKSRLAQARQFEAQAAFAYGEKYKELIVQIEAVRDAWENDNALLVAEKARTETYRETVEKELRQEVIDYCRDNDTKKFDDELSIRVAIKLDYELEAATAWAKTNAPFILVADKKEFEAIAKKQELDFVTKNPAYSAVIATNLSSEGQVAE